MRVIVDGVSKTYVDRAGRPVRALEGIDLTVDSEEFVAVLGPSGCGKSTLLNLVAGLLSPSAGAIWLEGELAPDRVATAMVFQEFALPKGRMFVRGELVRPQAIRAPGLLTIEGELDDISGNGQTEAAHALCLNIPRERRAHFVAPGVGHYGIFSGRRWREVVFPRVREFIAAYNS